MSNLAQDSTKLKSGTLKGNPSYFAGCETVCGTKQHWNISITPAISGSKTRFKVKKFLSALIISMNAESTEGGACTGSWGDVSNPAKHQIEIILKIYDGTKILSNNSYFVRDGSPVSIPITEYGRYNFSIKTKEWGEECNKPKNESSVNLYIEESKDDQNGGGNGGRNGGVDDGGGEGNALISPLKWTLAILAGGGIFLALSSTFK